MLHNFINKLRKSVVILLDIVIEENALFFKIKAMCIVVNNKSNVQSCTKLKKQRVQRD